MATFRLIDWFFKITETATSRGTRFRNGDRPPQATFEDLFHSQVFRTEVAHRAKDDTGNFDASTNGHVVMATGDQVKAYTAQPVDRTLAVGADQVTEVVNPSAQEIGDFNGPVTTVQKKASDRRNIFSVIFSGEYTNWFNNWYEEVNNRLIPSGGNAGQVLTKTSGNDYDVEWADGCDCVVDNQLTINEGIPLDTNILVIYDTSSFNTLTSRVPAQTMAKSWYDSFVAANPNYTGVMYEVEEGNEAWVTWPGKWNQGFYTAASRIVYPDGTIEGVPSINGDSVGNNEPIDPSVDRTKFVLITFIDEASDYHGVGVGDANQPAESLFISHTNNFINNDYPLIDFFKGIIYPAQGATSIINNSAFHAHLTKAITTGTLSSDPGITAAQIDNSWGPTAMDFMTSSNPYTAQGVDGLENYGWNSYEYALTTTNIADLPQSNFNAAVEDALTASADTKVITITSTITLASGDTLESSVNFEINNQNTT